MSITFLFVIITVIISFLAFYSNNFMNKFIFSPSIIISRKQFSRFLTSGFIHGDIYHLLFNMFALYSFGNFLESSFYYYFHKKGLLYFAILYLLGIIIANIPTFLINRNKEHHYSLGASGGVNAIVFSCILISPTSPICIFYFICLPGFILGLLYLMYSIYAAKTNFNSGIGHWAHISGAIFGVIYTFILEPKFLFFSIFQIKNFLINLF